VLLLNILISVSAILASSTLPILASLEYQRQFDVTIEQAQQANSRAAKASTFLTTATTLSILLLALS